jgi:SEC-C motif-containing protein
MNQTQTSALQNASPEKPLEIAPEIPFVPLKAGDCPCGSGQKLESCCLPYLQGKKKAENAERLLRSRYVAFTRGEIDYVLGTHHSRTRDQVSREEITDWARSSEWHGLRVIRVTPHEQDPNKATLVFHARYSNEGKLHEHYEQSEFEKEGADWKFVDAIGLSPGPIRRTEPKIGRNDPCPCGSGKKHKKCHGN